MLKSAIIMLCVMVFYMSQAFAITGTILVTDAPYSAKCDGTTDDTAAIQHALTDASAHFWNVEFPTGICRVTSTVHVTGSVVLIGTNLDSTSLRAFEDITVIDLSSAVTGGVRDMSIIGYMQTSATHFTVIVMNNAVVSMEHFRVWGGNYAMYTAGNNAFSRDGQFAGWAGGSVLSVGANFYSQVSFDQGIVPTFAGFVQSTPLPGNTIVENTFTDCDFSGSFAHSIWVDDGGTHSSVLRFNQGIFSSPINIFAAQSVVFIAPEFGSDVYTSSPTTIVGAVPVGGTHTAFGGPFTCAANRGLIGC